MTNYERLFSDKRKLAEALNQCCEFYTKADDWFCKNACPRAGNNCDDCLEEIDSVDVIMMWLDAECKE